MKPSHRIAGIAAVVISSVLLIVFTYLYKWFPEELSPASGKIDGLYRFMTAVSIPFFVIIVSFMLFCVIEFRADPADPPDKDGEPIHGSTKLELIWTIIPLIVVIVLGIYAWIVLDQVEAKQKDPLTIKVVGQQFIWNYEYPELGVKTSGDLVVPVNKPLEFKLTADDVIHSFWVPAARLKRDATPGFISPLRFTPDKTGSFPIVCAELCGAGHAVMRSTLRVVTQAEFDKWLKEQKGGGKAGGATGAGGEGADGKSVFTSAGCGACHKLADAGSAGTVGPDLDGLNLSAAELREAIVDPDAKIADGYPKGVMPKNFGDTISKSDLDALVEYLAQAGK